MAGIEQQDVKGLGLGQIIAAPPAARLAWATARHRRSGAAACCQVGRRAGRACGDVVRVGWLARQAIVSGGRRQVERWE